MKSRFKSLSFELFRLLLLKPYTLRQGTICITKLLVMKRDHLLLSNRNLTVSYMPYMEVFSSPCTPPTIKIIGFSVFVLSSVYSCMGAPSSQLPMGFSCLKIPLFSLVNSPYHPIKSIILYLLRFWLTPLQIFGPLYNSELSTYLVR